VRFIGSECPKLHNTVVQWGALLESTATQA